MVSLRKGIIATKQDLRKGWLGCKPSETLKIFTMIPAARCSVLYRYLRVLNKQEHIWAHVTGSRIR